MPNQNHRPPVTIEQLLRLKRAEQPTEEFWNRFERELRDKQLAALVEKRPWWQNLPQVFARRAYLPIGATAILAFSLVSVKFYAPTELAQVDELAGAPTAVVAKQSVPVRVESEAASLVAAVVSTPTVTNVEISPQPVTDRVAVAAPEATSVANSPSDVADLISWSAPTAAEPASASARNIAANIARLEQTQPDLVNVLSGRRAIAGRVQTTSSQGIAELATIATSISKRGRLLAQFNDRQFTPEPQAPEMVRERLARRLADPETSDRVSRIGIKGDPAFLGLTVRL